jgi:hypothetical protein
MQRHTTNLTETEMTLAEILPVLMYTIDRTPDPLALRLSAMESQVSEIEHEFLSREKRYSLLDKTLDFGKLSLYEFMNMNRALQSAVIEGGGGQGDDQPPTVRPRVRP